MTREELLLLLMEECAEVQQAAAKCIRFGFDREYPGYGRNDLALAKEVGELFAVIDELDLDKSIIEQSYDAKIARAEAAKEEAREDEHDNLRMGQTRRP